MKVLDSRGIGHGERGEVPAGRAIAEKAKRVEPAGRELERIVRAAAISSSSEADFVRAVRAEGALIRPRFATGTTDVVVGTRWRCGRARVIRQLGTVVAGLLAT
ncbi:hypothetical protein [Herbiconiux sp. VKM Ac-2851]|uniref:hypothetical protein n=1 Tax=Herbiconiux sp. VKM Ac-2851 TaxID=2739025 RepID=UPI001563B9DA|nr:hypothetical protein [Herbiconiux sp. VKM Ac-2851]NQX34720.1 hypothetical protein [Herbiconiux sp. VKM Ac-2851]